jgi:hypothetical protein
MRIELAGGSVKRLVSVWRDSKPLPGEKAPTRIAVDYYGCRSPKTVTVVATVATPRWQQFIVDSSPEGDELLAALKDGPIEPGMRGDSWLIDLDRVKRAR